MAGFIYFGVMILLLWLSESSFKSKWYARLLVFVQCMSAAVIFASFITVCPQISDDKDRNELAFYGINSILTFMDSITARGHIICECLLFLLTCVMNRLVIYA